eukprot:TRINITY_DN13183_c0_g1_i1.p1 TRINITY_DN13183_c0_g1~~TRINITY_DN13183_c0_g1_i1.p1  ORF type:complete len:149 (+),score=2.36 TRINITY_DN13183_c0_g1_i1:63-449(+)
MAARLVLIKSKSLLPKDNDSEDLEEELRKEIIDYKIYKELAYKLKGIYSNKIYVREPLEYEVKYTYKNKHNVNKIYIALINAVGKNKSKLPPPKEAFSKIIERKVVPIPDRIKAVSYTHLTLPTKRIV